MIDTGVASFRIYLLPENSGDKTKNGCLLDFAQRSNATHVQAFITFREYIYETFVGHHFVSKDTLRIIESINLKYKEKLKKVCSCY